MQGGEQSDYAMEFGISQEALKKHLRAIFDATGIAKWADLTAVSL